MSGSLGVYSNKCHMVEVFFIYKSLWLHVPWADTFIRDYEYPKFWWRGPTLYHLQQ